jgi:spartin
MVPRACVTRRCPQLRDQTNNCFPDPVEIQLPGEGQGNSIQVNNVSDEYLQMSRHPAYQKSTIVQTSATASRLIVTGSTYIANAMNTGADSFQKKTKPNPKPMTFTPAAHARIRKINNFSQGAVGLSAKTVGQVSRYAQNIGAGLTGKGDKKKTGYDKDGKPVLSYKPGILNKSMIAFSTIADGIDQAGRHLLQSGSTAATTVVGHKYGDEARSVAADVGGGFKNVGLVYIDAAGVSRKAVIKSVAKGMVVGRMPNGQQLVVGAGDGGVVPQAYRADDGYPADMKQTGSSQPVFGSTSSSEKPGTEPVGFGTFGTNPAPPTYGSGVGENLHGQYAPEKY